MTKETTDLETSMPTAPRARAKLCDSPGAIQNFPVVELKV